jgi:hypothetical protein
MPIPPTVIASSTLTPTDTADTALVACLRHIYHGFHMASSYATHRLNAPVLPAQPTDNDAGQWEVIEHADLDF